VIKSNQYLTRLQKDSKYRGGLRSPQERAVMRNCCVAGAAVAEGMPALQVGMCSAQEKGRGGESSGVWCGRKAANRHEYS
jgi:hypothetical protein